MPDNEGVFVVADFLLTYTQLIGLNNRLRSMNCGFIIALNFGLGGFIFLDYGDKFTQFKEENEQLVPQKTMNFEPLANIFNTFDKSALYSGDASLVLFFVFVIRKFEGRELIVGGKKLFQEFKQFLPTLELKIPVKKLQEIEALCNSNLRIESPLVTPVLGVAAGEVFKFTGIFDPIQQLTAYEVTKTGSSIQQGNSMTSYHSPEVLTSLSNLRIAMVGAGASGSEFAKSAALLHMCSKGKLMIFDDDLIQISNLNRQFLFQRSDVGKSKAIALAHRIMQMRPTIQVQGYNKRIDSSTFGSVNWKEVDLIISAVDSRSA